MLKRTDNSKLPGDTRAAPAVVPPAIVVADLVTGALATPDPRVILIVEDEARADTIARLAAGFSPETTVVHLVASDALPGESAPPSAASADVSVCATCVLCAVTAAEGTSSKVVSTPK